MTPLLTNSRNIPAAKEFLKWWFRDDQYNAWWRLQEGYHLQHVKKSADDPIWFKMGYAGPPGEKASLALSKYIVVDTFAKAVQSGDAAGAIKWGADQLQRIYG